MRLRKLLLLTTLLLLLLVTVMLFRAGVQEYKVYRSAQEGLRVLQLTRLAMHIAEKISFERGPANVLMASDSARLPALRSSLELARKDCDQAFADAFAAFKAVAVPQPSKAHSPPATTVHTASVALTRAREQLQRVRADINRIGETPKAKRERPVVIAATHDMFAVIDVVLEAVAALSGHAGRIYPDLVDQLVASQLAAELREQAGRLGSEFTYALMQQVPLDEAEIRSIQLIEGRIEQLLNLIWRRALAGNIDARQSAEIADIRTHYVDAGLSLVKRLAEASHARVPYGMDAAGFADLYVPRMIAIVHLRDTMFNIAYEGARAGYERARNNLLWQWSIGLAVILIEIAVFLFIRRRVLRPLIAAHAALAEISRGNLDIDLPPVSRRDEIGDMLYAVAALKATSIEKRQLEEDRNRMIHELRETSNIDYLTGLMNRRAFFERAAAQLSTAVRHQWQVTIIALDIDHFKSINDQHGHAHGDAVLVDIAQRIKRIIRLPDVAARFGGEEFVVFAGECDSAAGLALAERIRSAVAASAFTAGQARFSVTLSAGVITVPATEVTALELTLQQADAALYAAKRQGRNRTVVARPALAPAGEGTAANPASRPTP